MPGGGSRPEERRGGRQKGTRNKVFGKKRVTIPEKLASIQVAKAATRAETIPQGFDSIDQMRLVAKYFMDRAKAEIDRGDKADRRVVAEQMLYAHSVLRDLARYEHPQLSAVKVAGDPNAPLNLSGLTDAELVFFRRITVKLFPDGGP